jgi:hypothetical protein
MTDAVAARAVRTECLIEGRFSFCQLQSFMRGMILLANRSWQDRVPEKFSIFSGKLQARESPNDRRKLSDSVFEGLFWTGN